MFPFPAARDFPAKAAAAAVAITDRKNSRLFMIKALSSMKNASLIISYLIQIKKPS
jgi:hypothetical protein